MTQINDDFESAITNVMTATAARSLLFYANRLTHSKSNAIHKIKCQPFYGDYWKKPESGVATIRRPVEFKEIAE